MSVNLNKHDVALNGVGFRLSSYTKGEASNFIPRFNTGSETENHLGFAKEISFIDYRGGSFQYELEDKTKALYMFGSPNQRTGALRSTPVGSGVTPRS